MNNSDVLRFRMMRIIRVSATLVGLPARLHRWTKSCGQAMLPARSATALQAWRIALQAGLLWCGALGLWADTHYVSLDGTNDSVNGYITWAGAATQIQWAINAASAGETVLVSNGTYHLTNQVSLTNNITVRSLNGTNVTFVNGNYSAYTNSCFFISNGVLDGLTITNGYNAGGYQEGGGGVFSRMNGSVFNCFIYKNYCSNTNSRSGGGGIFLRQGGIVSNCTVLSNIVYDTGSGKSLNRRGGGIFIFNGNATIIASRISGNTARDGGGIVGYRSGIQTITNCIVDGNRAFNQGGGITFDQNMVAQNCVISNNNSMNNGGGVSISGGGKLIDSIVIGNVASTNAGGVYMLGYGATMISNCQVIANTASNSGGGILFDAQYCEPDSIVIADCVIAGNVANKNGAGIYSIKSGNDYSLIPTNNAIVRNCLIYGNTNLTEKGGGVYLCNVGGTRGPYVLINCTIAGNQAVTLGGGVWAGATNSYIGGTIINCIIYSNATTGDDFDEIYNNNALNTNNYSHTCVRSTAGADTTPAPLQGNITNNPLFVDQASRDYRLNGCSPCVNTGTNQDWMTNSVDLDGRMRIRYNTVDMGVYETIYKGTICSFH